MAIGPAVATVLLCAHERCVLEVSLLFLAHTALSTFLRAVAAILAVLARIAGRRSGARRHRCINSGGLLSEQEHNNRNEAEHS